MTLDSLRAQIGLVLQNNLVFNDTVANNIGCGDPSYTLPQIIEAAKLAHAHQFIQRLPHGYETPIGELGHSLRPGEQFRIALARAILRDPALFIIEEPSEQLDEDTKDLLDDTLEPRAARQDGDLPAAPHVDAARLRQDLPAARRRVVASASTGSCWPTTSCTGTCTTWSSTRSRKRPRAEREGE